MILNDHVHFRSRPHGDAVFEALEGKATWSVGETPPSETTILVDGTGVEHIPNIPLLRAVIVPWAGVGKEILRAATARGCPVYNVHHNAIATAEMAIALLMAAARCLQQTNPAMQKGDWTRPNSIQLYGRSATVYGYGAIGRHVGHICRALGMEVIGVRRETTEPEEGVVGDHRLEEALAQSNFLIVTAPLTPETEGRIGMEQLRSLLSPRVVVNVGRGPIVQESALYEALTDGTLYAAGLDVWYQYPKGEAPHFPSKFPIHELPNVVMTPHCGGGADQAERLRAERLAQLLEGLIKGDRFRPIDPEAGY